MVGWITAEASVSDVFGFKANSGESFITWSKSFSEHAFVHILVTNVIVLTLLLYGGFFTGGLLSALILFWNGFLISIAFMQISAYMTARDLLYAFALHGSIEVPALIIAANKSFRGIKFYRELWDENFRMDLIPSWKEYALLVSLLVIAALIESHL